MVLFRVLCIHFVLKLAFMVNGARILGVFPVLSKSHYTIGNELIKELARRGHDVVFISCFEEKNPPPNYRNIKLNFVAKGEKADLFLDFNNPYYLAYKMNQMTGMFLETTLDNPEVKNLLSSSEKFDAVIMDGFNMDGLAYFAHHFKAHNILFLTTCVCSAVNHLVANPAPPSAVAELYLNFNSEMNFFQRIQNSLFYLYYLGLLHWHLYRSQNKIIQQHIPGAEYIKNYLYNSSLVLINGHESVCDSVPLVPSMKNVAGLHLAAAGELPEDLQEFMDNSKEGVVYFSMGSALRGAELPPLIRESILRVFSKLKTKILWKWEDDVLPGKPSNVKLGKWFPQKELLAHPNLVLFITHGGLLSTIEAVHNGVPLLTLPVFGDQKLNAAGAALRGYAINIPFIDFDEDKFEAALKELLENPKYKQNALKRSQIFNNRPIKPMDEAVFWVEYVLRHNGAQHLRVAGLKLAWYQYLLVDVTLFLGTPVVVVVVILVYVAIRALLRRRKPINTKEKKRKRKLK